MVCKYKKNDGCQVIFNKTGEWRHLPPSVCNEKCDPGQVEAGAVKSPPCKGCGAIKQIVGGFGKLAWQRISGGKADEETVRRAEVCSKCEWRTFLSVTEWAIGAISKKELPINHEPSDWDALWCSKCKCCIEAAIRAKDKKCPEGKWFNEA